MTKVLALYYSSYGHIEAIAYAAAEGAREGGAEAVVRRGPELVPEEVARKSGYKLDQPAPIATVDELPDYDAVIFGAGTRYGNMTAQLKSFLGQTLRWDGVRSLADGMRMPKEQVARTPPHWVRVNGGFTELQSAERRLPTLDSGRRYFHP